MTLSPVLTLLGFFRHRIQFREVISSNGGGMTISRYLRLMLLSISEMVCTIPIGAYSIYINTAGVILAPWVSWADTHYNFSHVEMVPAIFWRSNRPFLISVVMGQWVYIFAAFLFFALFGFADEAKRHYRLAFWWVVKWFGIRPKPQSGKQFGKLGGSGWVPQFSPFFKPSLIRYRRFSYGKPSPCSPDFQSLPPYSPPSSGPYAARKRPESLSPSLAESFGNLDLEKGPVDARSPARRSEFSTSTDYAASEDGIIIIGPECPASTPPTPDGPRPLPAAVVPSYHRPFSPPVTWPPPSGLCPPSPQRKPSVGSISIMVHTESTTF